MIIQYQNYRGVPNPTQYKVKDGNKVQWFDISDGDTFDNCQFCQFVPHTAIMESFTGLTFFQCNLENCDIGPQHNKPDDCFRGHFEYCTNHPDNEMMVKAGAPLCPKACKHMRAYIDEVVIDGTVVLEKVVEYEARYHVQCIPNHTTTQVLEGVAVKKDTPITIPKKFTTPTLTKKQLDNINGTKTIVLGK